MEPEPAAEHVVVEGSSDILDDCDIKQIETEIKQKKGDIKTLNTRLRECKTRNYRYGKDRITMNDLLKIIQNMGVHHNRRFNEWSLIENAWAMYDPKAFGYEILPKLLVYFALIDSIEDKMLQQNAIDEFSKSFYFLIGENDEIFLEHALNIFEEAKYYYDEHRTKNKLEQNKKKFISFIKQLTKN